MLNFDSTSSRARWERFDLKFGDCTSFSIASASSLGFLAGTNKPVSLSVSASGIPFTLVDTIGRANDIASRMEMGKASSWELQTKMSSSFRNSRTFLTCP